MSLYLSLSLYILSLLVALVLVITGKKQREAWRKAALALHVLFVLLFVVYLLQKPGLQEGSPFRYAFLAALCSGLVAGGFILRSEKHWILKLYCSIYFLSLLFFLFSPSRFAAVLSRGDLAGNTPKKIHVVRNFFLEAQHAAQAGSGKKEFKLVQEFGIFHRTIRRDIAFDSEPDSLQVLEEDIPGLVRVMIYLHPSDTASHLPSRRELTLSLAPNKTDPIQRKQY